MVRYPIMAATSAAGATTTAPSSLSDERGQPSSPLLSSSTSNIMASRQPYQQPVVGGAADSNNLAYRGAGDRRSVNDSASYLPEDSRTSLPPHSLTNTNNYDDSGIISDAYTPPPNGGGSLSPGYDRAGRELEQGALGAPQAKRDRSRQPGSRRPSGPRICGKCGGNLNGQFVRALENTYHLECFTCHVCDFFFSFFFLWAEGN